MSKKLNSSKLHSSNNQPAESAPTKEFTLPIGIAVGSEFSSIDSFKKFLKKQADKLDLPNPSNIFDCKYEPNRNECTTMVLTCRTTECQAHVHFVKADKMFRVSTLEQQLYDDPPTTQEELENLLKKMKYRTLSSEVHSSLSSSSTVFTFISEQMKANYAKYPTMVYFDTTSHQVRGLSDERDIFYRLGLFYVLDSNLRMLIVGASVLEKITKQEYYECFSHFFKLQSSKTRTFVTSNEKAVMDGVQLLKKYKQEIGDHIIDPWHVMNSIEPRLTGGKETRQLALKRIKQAIFSRNLTEYTNLLTLLVEDEENKEVYDEFISLSSKISYCEQGKTFVGIQRFSRQRISHAIKEFVSEKILLSRLVISLAKAEKYLSEKSLQPEMFKEHVEVQFKDDRVRSVRENFEKKVFMRFLENYVIAMQHLVVTSRDIVEEMPRKYKFSIINTKTSEQLTLLSWNCECLEMERTGVACPHLIACARTVEQVSFTDLLDRLWRLAQPVTADAQKRNSSSKQPI